jgi:hypothetical protein
MKAGEHYSTSFLTIYFAMHTCYPITPVLKSHHIGNPHKHFIIDLATGLLAKATPRIEPSIFKPKQRKMGAVRAIAKEHGESKILDPNMKGRCRACTTAGRITNEVTKRKPLGELSINSISSEPGNSDVKTRRKAVPSTRYGCVLCNMWLCHRALCWEEHIIEATQLGHQQFIVIK